jgi:AmiR/NasT family two-component response regulator
MARHSINADKAFQRLRDHSQQTGRKLGDIAASVVDSHLLLVAPAAPSGPPPVAPAD